MVRPFSVLGLFFALVLITFQASGQGTKIMTPDVYTEWRSIENPLVSNKGETFIYHLARERHNAQLHIFNALSRETITFERAKKSKLSSDGNYIYFIQELDIDSVRNGQRVKPKDKKLINDTLIVYNMKERNTMEFNDVSDFQISEVGANVIAFLQRPIVNDSIVKKEGKKDKACDGKRLIIYDIDKNCLDTLESVVSYTLAKNGKYILIAACYNDTIKSQTVYLQNLSSKINTIIQDSIVEASQMVFDDSTRFATVMYLSKESKLTNKPYQIRYGGIEENAFKSIDYSSFPPKYKSYTFNKHYKLNFAKTADRLFVDIIKPTLVKDTLQLDEETINVEIWSTETPLLYTQQEALQDKTSKDGFLSYVELQSGQLFTIENDSLEWKENGKIVDRNFALLTNPIPYQKSKQWLGDDCADLYYYDYRTNKTTKFATNICETASLSPEGKYVTWFNKEEALWYCYSIFSGEIFAIGQRGQHYWADERHDTPSLAGPYGIGGWTKSDMALVLYDRYDMYAWQPNDPLKVNKLTSGRDFQKVYRMTYSNLENELPSVLSKIVVHVTDELTKKESYIELDPVKRFTRELISGDFSLSRKFIRPKRSLKIFYTKESFSIYPDFLVTNDGFTSTFKVTDANPQQANYAWGSNQLLRWTDREQKVREGMLFLPPNFNPKKKYPLIVNFYERSSDELHEHRPPKPHRSTINYTYYTNQGFIIFNPDIVYNEGSPGEDCYQIVNSGVDALLREGYIDSTKMALQGHSWGGYQIAYILTRTNRFACAESGAPVVNMFSAYGGVRWGTGLSRVFQYEKTQSRIGKTLWEAPDLYQKNSPLFNMDKVKTPVLIMHNDEDAAVPWEQGIEYFMALRRLGKKAWLLNYNGEPHWPTKFQNIVDFNIRLEQFLKHYLMKAPMPMWMKEGNTPQEIGILNKY